MDPRERFESPRVAITAALDGRQAEVWTAMPGFIVSYNAARQTCVVQIAIGIQIIDPLNTDNPKQANIPQLYDCPVVFPHGGGFTLTFPIQPNDECLVVLASRCIDNWWAQGPTTGVNQQQPPQGDLRMHDLSDGFVLVGPRSLPHALSAPSTNTVQLRSDDGQAYFEIDGSHNINVITPGNIVADAGGNATVSADGNVSVAADGSATVTANGPIQLTSLSSITFTAPTNTIKANGHILG